MYGSTALIAGLGIAVLTGLTFGATDQSRQIAVLIPPWATDGFARATSTGLAIVDLRWRNHIIILDTGDDPAALARLRDLGFWLLDATGAGLCSTPTEGELS